MVNSNKAEFEIHLSTRPPRQKLDYAAPQLELKDWEAHEMYNQGIKDAKKIDVRGRRLKGAEED